MYNLTWHLIITKNTPLVAARTHMPICISAPEHRQESTKGMRCGCHQVLYNVTLKLNKKSLRLFEVQNWKFIKNI